MTEREFTIEAKKIGIADKDIKSVYDNFRLLREHEPEIQPLGFLDIAKKTQDELNDSDDGSLTACGGWY